MQLHSTKPTSGIAIRKFLLTLLHLKESQVPAVLSFCLIAMQGKGYCPDHVRCRQRAEQAGDLIRSVLGNQSQSTNCMSVAVVNSSKLFVCLKV